MTLGGDQAASGDMYVVVAASCQAEGHLCLELRTASPRIDAPFGLVSNNTCNMNLKKGKRERTPDPRTPSR
jgi:hypothetical protein